YRNVTRVQTCALPIYAGRGCIGTDMSDPGNQTVPFLAAANQSQIERGHQRANPDTAGPLGHMQRQVSTKQTGTQQHQESGEIQPAIRLENGHEGTTLHADTDRKGPIPCDRAINHADTDKHWPALRGRAPVYARMTERDKYQARQAGPSSVNTALPPFQCCHHWHDGVPGCGPCLPCSWSACPLPGFLPVLQE